MITITANDETRSLAAGTPLTTFLADNSLSPDIVLVEYNGTALTRSEAKTQVLKDGDRLEIVRIVAGG